MCGDVARDGRGNVATALRRRRFLRTWPRLAARRGQDEDRVCSTVARRCVSYSVVVINANDHRYDVGRERRSGAARYGVFDADDEPCSAPAAARKREGGRRAAATDPHRPNAPLGRAAPHARPAPPQQHAARCRVGRSGALGRTTGDERADERVGWWNERFTMIRAWRGRCRVHCRIPLRTRMQRP